MDLKILEMKDETLRFVISGINPAFANSLRRTIIQGVPVMAIDEVEFVSNDTVMSDEILAHRLGQMPLTTPGGYVLPSECDCREGRCPKCSADLTLATEGPKLVRAKDLESSDPEVVPVQKNAAIAHLAEDQRLEFDAIVRLGFGRDHANWQPAVSSYKYMPIVRIDQEKCDDWGKVVESCPEDILLEEEGELRVTDLEKCTMCGACVEVCPEAVEVEGDPTTFIFNVESTGSMPPEKLVVRAAEILSDKCAEFSEKAERL